MDSLSSMRRFYGKEKGKALWVVNAELALARYRAHRNRASESGYTNHSVVVWDKMIEKLERHLGRLK